MEGADDKGKEEAPLVTDAEDEFPPSDTSERPVTVAVSDDPALAENEGKVLVSDPTRLYDVCVAEWRYGPGHRAIHARAAIPAKTVVLSVASNGLYVSRPMTGLSDQAKRIFHSETKVAPKGLDVLPDGHFIALCGLLAARGETRGHAILDPTTGLHGRSIPEKVAKFAYEIFSVVFADTVDLQGEWPFERFGSLYSVVVHNAMSGVLPLANTVYGTGIYPEASLFNHSCSPNCILVQTPDRVYIQTTHDVEARHELTIAYRELPTDLLDPKMVKFWHAKLGFETICRCDKCLDDTEDDPDAEEEDKNIIDGNLENLWTEKTLARLQTDRRLRGLVTNMLRGVGQHPEAAAGASGLRQHYSQILIPPTDEEIEEQGKEAAESDYCPDLAYVLGELYVTDVIHVEGQLPDDYLWWPLVFQAALSRSDVNMGHATLTASLSAAFAIVQISAGRGEIESKEGQKAAAYNLKLFVDRWVALRFTHRYIFGHLAFLTLPCAAHEVLATMSTIAKANIEHAEQLMVLEIQTAMAKEAEQAPSAAAVVPPTEIPAQTVVADNGEEEME